MHIPSRSLSLSASIPFPPDLLYATHLQGTEAIRVKVISAATKYSAENAPSSFPSLTAVGVTCCNFVRLSNSTLISFFHNLRK